MAATLPAEALAAFPGENGEIAFVSGRNGGDASADVYLLEQAGDLTPTPLTSGAGQHRHPAWSPDLTKLAFARWNSGANNIFVGDIDEPNPQTRLGFASSGVQADRPAWSPDGTRIAYESEVTDGSGQQDILVATVDEDGSTASEINLTNSPTLIEGKPAWSPDGKTIYYSRRGLMSADDDIVREPANNSSDIGSLVVFSGTAEYQPAISPDGKRICFTHGAFGSAAADVYVADILNFGSGTPVNISDSAIGAYNCEWSPEGDQIAYVNGTFGAGSLVSESPNDADDVDNPTELTDNVDAVFDGNPNWAPKKPAFCQDRAATIAGTDAGETIFGTKQKDVIQGHNGRDRIIGRGGNDRICGGKGRDTISGGKDKDKLFGGPDRDKLNGGPDRDRCDGGPGKDAASRCEREDKIEQ
jgi:Tol biopolymer transport system component